MFACVHLYFLSPPDTAVIVIPVILGICLILLVIILVVCRKRYRYSGVCVYHKEIQLTWKMKKFILVLVRSVS